MSPEHARLLTRLVGDSHRAVVSAVTGAIAVYTDEELIRVVIRQLSSRAPALRQQHMRALRAHADTATTILVAEIDAGQSPDQLRALVQLAEALRTPQSLAVVVPLASHPDAEVRATVARALRWCFTPEAVDAARTLLRDSDWRVRAAAARALSSLNATGSIGELTSALHDDSWWVRFRAALALGSLGDAGSTALTAAATSDDPFAREMAVVVEGLSESARIELST
jgi:HEAT repeat protein